MAPRARKNSVNVAAAAPPPTRRSARLASREPSVVSNDEHSDSVGPRRQAPEQPEPEQRARPKRKRPAARAPKTAAVVVTEDQQEHDESEAPAAPSSPDRWNSSDAASCIVRFHKFDMIDTLTEAQCKAVIYSLAEQNREQFRHIDELQHSVQVLSEELEESKQRPKVSRLQRDFTLRQIEEQHQQALAQERAAGLADSERQEATASGPGQVVATPRSTRKLRNTAEAKSSVAESPTIAASPVRVSKEKRVLTAASPSQVKLPSSPVSDSPPPPPATAPSTWRRLVGYIGSPFIGRKRSAEEPEQPAQKRARMEQTTPSISHHQQARRDVTVPSSKNPRVPTSLSTITEFTEVSTVRDAPDTTPSRPSRFVQPQESSIKLPTTTPARHSTTSVEPPRTAPSFKAATTSERTRPWSQRAQREAERRKRMTTSWGRGSVHPESGFALNDGTRPWSWETKSGPRQPLLKNADERLAKIQRFRELQRQLQELSNDEDIVDIVSHKAKRVKVDHLASIPHNLPGDSSSTFRVPDIDSDGEMDVAEIVHVRENIFMRDEDDDEESDTTDLSPPKPQQTPIAPLSTKPAQTPVAQTPRTFPKPPSMQLPKPAETPQAPTPAPPFFIPSKTPVAPQPQAQAHSPSKPSAAAAPAASTPTFTFPNVGPVPASYHASPAFIASAHEAFTQGLNDYISASS